MITAIASSLQNIPTLSRVIFEQYDEDRKIPAVSALLEAKPLLSFSSMFGRHE